MVKHIRYKVFMFTDLKNCKTIFKLKKNEPMKLSKL